MKEVLMSKIADKIIDVNLKMVAGEKLLIVTETEKLSIANAIATAAYRKNIEPIISLIIPRETDSQEPPEIVAAALKAADAFVSVVGKSITHTNAIKNAIENGAVAIVIDDDEDIDTIEEDIAIITVKNSRRELSRISKNFYDNPSEILTVICITGTKGKSTTKFMIKSILQASGKKVGLLRKYWWIYWRRKKT